MDLVTKGLLNMALDVQDRAEANEAISRALADKDPSLWISFEEFATEQRVKCNLPIS